MYSKLVGNTIYFSHVALMTAFFFSGFFIDWRIVVLIYVLLEIQLIVFRGCIVTKLQQKMGFIDSDQDFIPVVVKKLFRIDISDFQHEILSYIIMAFPVFVVLIKSTF